jgi:hypothetical protein
MLDGGMSLNEETSEAPKRKELVPKGITCSEGIWSREAIVRFAIKTMPDEYRKLSINDAAQSLIKYLLTTPELEVFTVNSFKGEKRQVKRDFLRGRSAIDYFAKGFKPFSSDFHVSKEDGEFYFLNRTQFENFLADRPIVDPSAIAQPANATPSYIPPYMQFMLKAVTALELSSDKRTDKKVIMNWLKQNWPADLDGKSDRMIDSMATMLRSPEHKKGGNTSWKE